jgi:PGF-pre-PGF domain-containing protein
MTRTGYITVNTAPPVAAFTAGPLSGTAPLAVTFIDLSTGSPDSWSWDFGDGETSTSQNPSHVYGNAGNYSVSLTAANPGGSDTMTRSGYITVSAPAQTGSSGGSSTTGATAAAAVGGLAPGEEVTFTFQNPTIPIRSVTFTSATETGEVLITAIERSIPAGIPPPEIPVYKYVDIQTYRLPEGAVTGAVISFRVPRSWISSRDAEPSQVVLLRYHADAWDELPTEFIGAGNGYLQFRSPTPGFSLFAIGVNQSRGTREAVMTATTVSTLPRTPTPSVPPRITPATPEDQPSSPVSLFHTGIIIAGIVVLAVVGLILFFTFSRSLRSKRGGWL